MSIPVNCATCDVHFAEKSQMVKLKGLLLSRDGLIHEDGRWFRGEQGGGFFGGERGKRHTGQSLTDGLIALAQERADGTVAFLRVAGRFLMGDELEDFQHGDVFRRSSQRHAFGLSRSIEQTVIHEVFDKGFHHGERYP